MKILRFAPLALVLLVPMRAEAADVRLGVGADYVLNNMGLLELTLSVDGALARPLRVGGRFGAMLTSGPGFGAPLDLYLRLLLGDGRVYFDGLVGPWLFFQRAPLFSFHGAIGFGILSGGLSFGLEVGAIDIGNGTSGHGGLRLGVRI